jgi:hypothetical protein
MFIWRDIGTIYPDTQGYEVLHACCACGAVVCGGDIDRHEEWHQKLGAVAPRTF